MNLKSTKDVAKMLGISQSAVRIRVSKGKLPAPDKREGKELYWRLETISGITHDQRI